MTYTELQKELNRILEYISDQMYTGNYNGVYLKDLYDQMVAYSNSYIDRLYPLSSGTALNGQLKDNMKRFLAGKNFLQHQEMTSVLYDQNGIKIPKADFVAKAKSLNTKYNDSWFKTENNYMGNSIKVAKKMESYKNLPRKLYAFKYIATHDDLVRESHKALDGLVLPMDDPFWHTHTPPWDYNCRCSIQAVRIDDQDKDYLAKSQETIKKAKLSGEEMPQGLEPDTYGKGKFFTDEHPYIKDTNKQSNIDEVVYKLTK